VSEGVRRPSFDSYTRPRSTQPTLFTLFTRRIPVEPGTLRIVFTRYLAVCGGRCIVYSTVPNHCAGMHSPTLAAWTHTYKVFIMNLPQSGKLYAMQMFFCLFVPSFVRLSPTRTVRALVWLPASLIVYRPQRWWATQASGCEGLSSRPLGTCFYTVLS